MDYGIFVEFLPNLDGLAHHSRISGVPRHAIASTFAEGDELEVTVEEMTPEGKVSLRIGEPESRDQDDEPKRERKTKSAREDRPARSERSSRAERPARDERRSHTSESDEVADLDVEVGKIYLGKVTNIKAYGAFIELESGEQGMVHISELADHQVSQIEDIVDVGEEIYVKCIKITRDGKISLSRRAAITEA